MKMKAPIVVLCLKIFAAQRVQIAMLAAALALICIGAALGADLFLTAGEAPFSVAVVDLDGTIESRMIVAAITDASDYGGAVEFLRLDEASAYAALLDGTVAAIVTMPENFTADIMRGANNPFVVKYNSARPLASTLVILAADAFAGMLRSAQTGVYTAIHYARHIGLSGDDFNLLLAGVNLLYMGLILDRADIFAQETLYITGRLSILQTYFIAAYVALLLCASVVMTASLRRNFSPRHMRRLALRGVTYRAVFLSCTAAFFLLLCVINAAMLAFAAAASRFLELPLTVAFAAGTVIIATVAAAFAVMLVFAFRNAFAASVFAAVFVAASLFLSGGIIPQAFFSDAILTISGGAFNTWAHRLLAALILGDAIFYPLMGCAAFFAIFSAIGCIYAKRRGAAL